MITKNRAAASLVEAKERHIEVAGTLAVLLQASLRGYFDFPEAMRQLRQ